MLELPSENQTLAETKLLLGISVLEQEMAEVRARIAARPTLVPIQTLAPHPVEVTKPILAVVQPDDGAWAASWSEANVNASGDTELAAIDMLKDVIASTFRLFCDQEGKLADDLVKRFAIMREFLRAK